MKTIYRIPTSKARQTINDLIFKGFDVQEADRLLPFENILPEYKNAVYNAALKYGNVLDLEQAFAAKWLQDRGEKAELSDIPETIYNFILPQDEYPLPEGSNVALKLVNEKKSDVTIPILVDKSVTKYQVINGSIPNIEEAMRDFGELAARDVHTDVMPLFLRQRWYSKYKIVYRFDMDFLFEQMRDYAGIVAVSSPAGVGRALSCERGKLTHFFGQPLHGFLLSKVVKEIKEITYTVPFNFPGEVSAKTVVLDERAKTVIDFDRIKFGNWVLDKLRPHGTGNGTVPTNVSVLTLLSAFLWETERTTPHANIAKLPDRKELVSLINKLHQKRYGKWLAGRKNSPELAIQYFEVPKHYSQTDSMIRQGNSLKEEVQDSMIISTIEM